jgi:predicted unusual protein kinase regulating ubiquinone biosynthesis (AarF/ABC1/UbiB family)
MLSFLKNTYFLTQVSCDIIYETSRYYMYGDLNNCIERLSNKLCQKNILYIKIFQACALNNNIFPDEINNKLIKFTDNAPWTTADIDMDTLLEFERENNMQIEQKDSPLKSGMISLIYKAKDASNNEHILKVKRKDIEAKLEDGVEKLLFFLKIVDWIPFINNYDLPAIIHKNIDLIRHQTNFPQEVKNIQKFTSLCEKLPYVKIPQVQAEVTQKFPNLILMEYMKGNTIYNVQKEDYEAYARQVLKFSFITLFLHGINHGDLHVGNILFHKDENAADNIKHKICILDFGIIYELGEGEARHGIFDIFTDMCSTPTDIIANKFLFSGLIEPVEIIKTLSPAQNAPMLKIISDFLNETIHVNKRLHPVHICKFLAELNTYANQTNIKKLRLRAGDDLVKFQVIFGMLHGVLLKLCGEDYIELSDKVMRETFHLE